MWIESTRPDQLLYVCTCTLMLSNGQSDFHSLHYLGSGDDTKRMLNLLMFTVQVNTHTCTVHYNHSIRCELNSLNFRATTSNLKGIYRFILNEKGRIQRLNGETMERKKRNHFGQFRNTLLAAPPTRFSMWNEMCNNLKWLILSGALLLLLLIVTGNWNVTKAPVISAWIQKQAGKYDFECARRARVYT